MAAEQAGGVAADIRIFLDAQLDHGDVLVDVSPDFGFVALGAATAPAGVPTVLVSGLPADRFAQLEGCALDVGASIEEAPAETSALQSLVTSRLGEQGRLFVHAACSHVPRIIETFRALLDEERLLAICIGDAHQDERWPVVRDHLAKIGFEGAALVEQKGQAMLVPLAGAPRGPVIALPSHVLHGR